MRFRSPNGQLNSNGTAAVTLVTMFCCSVVGFCYQQYLIEKHFSGPEAELHMMVKQIKQRELAEIASRGAAESAAAATHGASDSAR